MNKFKLYLVATVGFLLTSHSVADAYGEAVSASPYRAGITMTKSVQAGITPDLAVKILQAGNERFQAGTSLKRDLKKRVREIAPGQYPFASIVACADSRSAPEILFDQSIGDIFVTRIAGNIVNDDIIGSLEYAAKVLGTRVIVVLGHTNCGAIKGACDGVQMGHLTGLLNKIQPAVAAAKTQGVRNSTNHEFVEEVAEINVNDGIETIRQKSRILKELEDQQKIKIVGAFYDMGSGKVQWQ